MAKTGVDIEAGHCHASVCARLGSREGGKCLEIINKKWPSINYVCGPSKNHMHPILISVCKGKDCNMSLVHNSSRADGMLAGTCQIQDVQFYPSGLINYHKPLMDSPQP